MATTLTVPGTVTAHRSSRLMWAILGLVLLADALDVIDATVTNIAAPTIARELHGGVSLIQWLGPAYMLAMGVLLVIGGRLGDKYGQRRLFLIGMGGFTLASAVAGFSPHPAPLIAARIAQGAFGALLIPQGMSIMTKAFDRDMLAKAFALFGPVLALTSVGGPVLAGFIISADLFDLSWRPIFLANIILGVAGLIMAVKILPRDGDGDRSTIIDARGSALLAVTMLGLLYGLIEGSSNGWHAVPIASITIGVVSFAAFTHRQRTATHPLITPSLLRNRGFTSGLLVCLVAVAAGTGLIFVLLSSSASASASASPPSPSSLSATPNPTKPAAPAAHSCPARHHQNPNSEQPADRIQSGPWPTIPVPPARRAAGRSATAPCAGWGSGRCGSPRTRTARWRCGCCGGRSSWASTTSTRPRST
jgi:MFS family permease